MNIFIEKILQELDGVAHELFYELISASWDKPTLKNVDAAGFAISTFTGERRKRNEDRLVVANVTAISGQKFSVAMVCDGVGGSEMGDVAATLAISTFIFELSKAKTSAPLAVILPTLIHKMDNAVRNYLNGRGTTTVSVFLSSPNGEFVATNIGDSRIFSWQPGFDLQQVSVDDTFENEIAHFKLRDMSFLDERGLRGSLSQAIGERGRPADSLKIPIFSSSAFFHMGLILATDGAWKVNEAGFYKIVKNSTSGIDAVRRLSTFAGWVGGIDNVSAIAIEDIEKFLKNFDGQFSTDYLGLRICAWICDEKIIIREKNFSDYNRSNMSDGESFSGKPKRNLKQGILDKRSKAKNINENIQRDLVVEAEEEVKIKSNGKKKIEILIDDTPEKR